MKKVYIGFLLLVFHSSFSYAQWDSVGIGLGTACGGFSGFGALSIAAYNGNIYAGGFNVASNAGLAEWNGVEWDTLNGGTQACLNTIDALAVYGGNLYAGGWFPAMGDTNCHNIAYWDGRDWRSPGVGVGSISGGWITALCVYNGNLYAGGTFDSAGGIPAKNIAMWNGSSWSAVGSGINSNGVGALFVYNGKLYAGGTFDTVGGVPTKNIAAWNDTNWSAVGSGTNGFVGAICNYNGNLYFEGLFDSAGGIKANRIVEWNGSSWSALGQGLGGITPKAFVQFSLCEYNNSLIVGGGFDSAGGMLVHGVAAWNGSTWSGMGGGLAFTTGFDTAGAYTSLVYNNTLYVGGEFFRAGAVRAEGIAQWTGPLGIEGIENGIGETNIYPNPNNGIFTISLSHPAINGVSQNIIEIYNVLGERVYDGMLKQVQHDYEINISPQPSGVYFYRVLTEDGGIVGEGKVVVEK